MNFIGGAVENADPANIGDANSTRTYYSSSGRGLSTGNLKFFLFKTPEDEYDSITLCRSGKLMNEVCMSSKLMNEVCMSSKSMNGVE